MTTIRAGFSGWQETVNLNNVFVTLGSNLLQNTHEVWVAQFMRQLKMSVRAMRATAFWRLLVLARLQDPQSSPSMEMMQGRDLGFSDVVGEKGLQSEIKARHMIGHRFHRVWHCLHH